MTRQNVTEGVREILTKTCPTCEGESVVLSEETVAIDVERRLRELAAERPATEAFLIRLHPSRRGAAGGRPRAAAARDRGGDRQALPLRGLRGAADRPLHGGAGGLARGGRAARAALPEGDEVLVAIEEPHMYAEDDAVAKLDGYVISVAGAGKLVGKKTLVRIENVGRSAASATLVEGAEVIDDPDGPRPAGTPPPRPAARPRAAGGRAGAAEAGGPARARATETAPSSPRRLPQARPTLPPSPKAPRATPAARRLEPKRPRRRGRRGGRGRRKAAEAD